MNAEAKKAERERNVFRTFVEESGLQIDPESIESRTPPEPDILCLDRIDGKLAFELVEICAEDLAQSIAMAGKKGGVAYVRSSDPSGNAIRKKLEKIYRTEYPLDLLCYTDGRTVSPDDVIIDTIRSMSGINIGQFQRIWLLSTHCHKVWPC